VFKRVPGTIDFSASGSRKNNELESSVSRAFFTRSNTGYPNVSWLGALDYSFSKSNVWASSGELGRKLATSVIGLS
jgi:hypothetical protein